MKFAGVSFLIIGDELLDGRLADKNMQPWAQALGERGMDVLEVVFARDHEKELTALILNWLKARPRSGIICFGGLGPTPDDVTTAAVAAAAGVELAVDARQMNMLEQKYQMLGMQMAENNRKQAILPVGCVALDNPGGTAPGFFLSVGEGWIAAVPGPPSENHAMRNRLWPELKTHIDVLTAPASVTLRAFGTTEGRFAARVVDLLAATPEVSFHDRFIFPEIELTLKSHDSVRLQMAAAAVEKLPEVYGRGDLLLPGRLIAELIEKQQTVAVAESCTGGMIGSLLTDTAGASEVFKGGVIAYADSTKIDQLGVDEALLQERGAVSEEVVRAMAEGVQARLNCDWGLAVSGIAGPQGGSVEKPVGTVWIAWAGPHRTTARCWHLRWDRNRNRLSAAWLALAGLRAALGEDGGADSFDEPISY